MSKSDFELAYERDVAAARNEVERKLSNMSVELYSLMRKIRHCPDVVPVNRYNQFAVYLNLLYTQFGFVIEDAKTFVRSRVEVEGE